MNLRPMLIASAVVLLLMFGLSAYAWGQIPAGEQIPIHWGPDGQPDGWGGRFEGLLMMPTIVAATVGLLAIVPRIDPRRNNIAQSKTAYFATWGGLLLFFLVMHTSAIMSILGRAVNMSIVVGIFMGILFIVMGNYMGKIRSNFMFGVRTPWTLTSELSWNKTHRLIGRLFFATGLLTLIAAIVGLETWVIGLILVGTIGSSVISTIYSYIVWRNDPAVQQQSEVTNV